MARKLPTLMKLASYMTVGWSRPPTDTQLRSHCARRHCRRGARRHSRMGDAAIARDGLEARAAVASAPLAAPSSDAANPSQRPSSGARRSPRRKRISVEFKEEVGPRDSTHLAGEAAPSTVIPSCHLLALPHAHFAGGGHGGGNLHRTAAATRGGGQLWLLLLFIFAAAHCR